MTISNYTIETVSIIDDDEQARMGYEYNIEDLKLKPVREDPGPSDDVGDFIQSLRKHSNAVLCDYRLRRHNYSTVDGDVIVAECNQSGLPAILCTTFTDWDLTVMRGHRRFIPALLSLDELTPDAITAGFARCIREFSGDLPPSRQQSRTLVRVADTEKQVGYFYVIIPGWDPSKKIRVAYDDVPKRLRSRIRPEARLHAHVNVGAERHEDLYIYDWEPE